MTRPHSDYYSWRKWEPVSHAPPRTVPAGHPTRMLADAREARRVRIADSDESSGGSRLVDHRVVLQTLAQNLLAY